MKREDASSASRLIARLKAGDRDAEAALYRRHVGFVRAQLAKALDEDHDLDDALQDVFAAVFASLRRGAMPRSLRPWLATVARNHALRLREAEAATTAYEPAAIERLIDRGDRIEPDPHEEIVTRRATRQLTSALPPAQRRAIFLRYDMDLDWREVASALGISAEAARALHRRAIGSLRQRHSPNGADGRRDAYPALRAWTPSRVIHARLRAACWTL